MTNEEQIKNLNEVLDKIVEKANRNESRLNRLIKRVERFAHHRDALDHWVSDELRAAISEALAGQHGDY